MLRLTPYLFHDQKTIINVYPLNTSTEPQKVMHVTPTLSTLLEKKKVTSHSFDFLLSLEDIHNK